MVKSGVSGRFLQIPYVKWVLAIVGVQLVFWLGIKPVVLNSNIEPFERYATYDAEIAIVPSPEDIFSQNLKYKPLDKDKPWECCGPAYYSFRFKVDLEAVPATGLAFIPRRNVDNFRLYSNEHLVVSRGRVHLPHISYHGNLSLIHI